MAQAARLASRLQRELKMLQVDPPPGVCAWPCNDLLTHLQAQIMGPQDTVYSNGIFKLDIQVPERYPFEPPNIRFVTPVYHPNIDSGGRICLDILNLPPKGAWRPSLNLATLLASIGLLLAEPNPDDGLMRDITSEYKHNRTSFDVKARKWTDLYATQDQVAPDFQAPEDANSPNAVSDEVLALTGDRDCVTEEKTTGDGVARCVTSLQPTQPGPPLSKRLTLERGTQSVQNCKVDSNICRGSDVKIQRTTSLGKNNSPPIVPAEKRDTTVTCKDIFTKDSGASKKGKMNLSKSIPEAVTYKDKHADIFGATALGKQKFAAEIVQHGKGCKDGRVDICRDNIPIVAGTDEGKGRENSVRGVSNQPMVDKDKNADICGATDLGKQKFAAEIVQQGTGCKDGPMDIRRNKVQIVSGIDDGKTRLNSMKGVSSQTMVDKDKHARAADLGKQKFSAEIVQQRNGCKDGSMDIVKEMVAARKGDSVQGISNRSIVADMGRDALLDDVPCSLPKDISLGTENSTPAMTGEWRKCTEKENQAPKDAFTSQLHPTDISKATEKMRSPSFAPNGGRGKLKLMKEAGEQVRPTKSLKLSRTRGEQQSSPGSITAPGCKHLTDIEKCWNSPIHIPENVTVIVSDSDSDGELCEGHFPISLTQRSLNLKSKGSSKLW